MYYDLENLIEVIGSFKGRDDVAFAFVGEGAVKPRLEEHVRENGLSNVSFIPYQPKDELVYSLNAADVHLVTNAKGIKGVSCPSKAYGIMAANVPMIGILEPGSEIWRVVEESGCGALAETGDYEGIRDVLARVVDEKDAFVRAHATGRAYLERGLSRRSATERYVRALEEAMS